MADTDFSFIGAALDPSRRTAFYTVKEIPWDPPVVLEMRHAGPENRDYWTQGMEWKISNANGLENVAPPKVQSVPERLRWFYESQDREAEQARRCDIYLYPRLIVVGMTGLVDQHGKPVAFSIEAVEKLLRALPNHVTDKIFGFARNMANFYGGLERPQITIGDAEIVAGNS